MEIFILSRQLFGCKLNFQGPGLVKFDERKSRNKTKKEHGAEAISIVHIYVSPFYETLLPSSPHVFMPVLDYVRGTWVDFTSLGRSRGDMRPPAQLNLKQTGNISYVIFSSCRNI